MPRHVVLMKRTQKGLETFKSSIEGYDDADTQLQEMGVHFRDVYWTIGEYDLIATVETPDDETLAAALLSISSKGTLHMSALRAFTEQEIRGVVAKLA